MQSPPDQGGPLVLIVDEDAETAQAVAEHAATRNFRTEVASTPDEARAIGELFRPEVAVVSLPEDESQLETLGFLNDLANQSPRVLTLVATSTENLSQRVEVARMGTRGFLQKPLRPTEAVDAIVRLLERLRSSQTTVLVVDDDLEVLEVARDALEAQGMRVTCLDDPKRFWPVLVSTMPDLLALGLDMPDVNGLDLCRVIRNDPRWADLAVLFVTDPTTRDVIQQMFSVGADDYIQKPLAGPEFLARVNNRLERVRLHKAFAETDALTGVANRRRSIEGTNQLIRLADRYQQPLSVAILDLAGARMVNEVHGYGTGDEILRALGEFLLTAFRGEDVVSRWGGAEFFISMYGMASGDAVERIAGLLESFREMRFEGADGEFQVSFSAGIAAYPEDGSDVDSLYRSAGQALALAKAAGGDRVWRVGGSEDAPHVLVVEENESVGRTVARALATRSYSPRWFRSADDAEIWLQTEERSAGRLVALVAREVAGESALGIIERLNRLDGFTGTKTIVTGVRPDQVERVEAEKLHIVDFEPHPLSVIDLMKKVCRALV